ncbi:aldehyde dehydrogenase family protein, partial [bacterium]|nr:aldehyde dehydrogenase family protein [bacterium]
MNLQFHTSNPFNEQKISSYEYLNEDQVLSVIESSAKGFLRWSALSMIERKDYLARLKLEIAQRKSDLALCISREMGKPLLQANTEVEKSLQLIDYCLSVPESLFAEQRSKHHIVFKQALGVIYGIMPWNFPVWQSLRFSIPNLLVGNTILLKPADNVAGTALILQEAFSKAIDISGVYSNVFIQHSLSD